MERTKQQHRYVKVYRPTRNADIITKTLNGMTYYAVERKGSRPMFRKIGLQEVALKCDCIIEQSAQEGEARGNLTPFV